MLFFHLKSWDYFTGWDITKDIKYPFFMLCEKLSLVCDPTGGNVYRSFRKFVELMDFVSNLRLEEALADKICQ